MIAVIQRIAEGKVTVDGSVIANCEGKGILVLLGVAEGDEEKDAVLLADKIAKLRIFEDENERMNLSVTDVDGGIIVVPNFTLLASYRKGNRPDFMNSAHPSVAKPLFEYFADYISKYTEKVTRGEFGADMKVSIINDGPVTISMDSEVLKQSKKSV
ncbi:MAG: D-tyrosyl-tRNA(Tyr) deacylase [Ruminococcaceae bacterium]|nr:D-tyrosyl-tRNA(Tyr) deacylase [Oscillospiraceae bacterium]